MLLKLSHLSSDETYSLFFKSFPIRVAFRENPVTNNHPCIFNEYSVNIHTLQKKIHRASSGKSMDNLFKQLFERRFDEHVTSQSIYRKYIENNIISWRNLSLDLREKYFPEISGSPENIHAKSMDLDNLSPEKIIHGTLDSGNNTPLLQTIETFLWIYFIYPCSKHS